MVRVLGFEITRSSKLNKVALGSGGGDAYTSPQPWQTAMLGPGQPIYPVTPAADTELPRSIDYPISVNAQLTPRSGYGLLPFGILSNTYEKVPECRNPVLLIHRQLSSFKPRLVDKKNNVVNDHPMQWMCEYPDGSTPFSVWMTRYIKSTKIYDAPALYFERTRANEITGLHFIDGSTLFVILDEWGNTPKAESVEEYVQRQSYSFEERESQPLVPGSVAGPTTLNSFVEYYNRRLQEGKPVPAKVPAYTQVIKGTPFAWWSADDIWYMPESKRVNSPYGEPFIEAAWVWVNIIVNLVTFELAHYRTGNMPEGFVTLPKDWLSTPDQVEALERAYNARMSSNPATERNRLRFFPDGSKYIPTKRNSWEQALYERANQVIRDAIGVPSAETGDMPGEGLGGKGMKEANTTELNRNTMNPNRNTIMTPFNFALRNNGVTDVTFSLDAPVDEIDPDKLKASVYEGMTRGTYTLNDALAQLNMQPVGDPNDENNIANKHLIVAGQGIYVVEDMEVANGMAVPAQFQGADQAGGVPAGPETAMGNPEHTPEDQQTLQQFIKRVERGEPINGKRYFVMKNRLRKEDVTHSDGCMVAAMIPPTIAQQLRALTESIGLPAEAELEAPENMHVTLAYMPNGCDEDQLGEIVSIVSNAYAPLTGVVDGFGVFNGEGGKRVLFALLDCPALPALRTDVCRSLDAAAIEIAQDHGFTPHITLAYFPETFALPGSFSVPRMDVSIDRLTCAFGQDKSDYPLYGTMEKFNEKHDEAGRFAPGDGGDGGKVLGGGKNDPGRTATAPKQGEKKPFQPPSKKPKKAEGSVRNDAGPFHIEDAKEAQDPNPVMMEDTTVTARKWVEKHCGVCDEDDAYYGAPISREVTFNFPNTNHANDVEIVAMAPEDLPAKSALWKPEGGEREQLSSWIGGPQYVREEAAYLIDRSLGFMLVPVAYVSESYGEVGAAIYYSHDMAEPKPPDEYDLKWVERAGVLDFILAQHDRGYAHNYKTHPDESGRMILFDNGLCLPSSSSSHMKSPFIDLIVGKVLSEEIEFSLKRCLNDASTWIDVVELVGLQPTLACKIRIAQLLFEGAISASSRTETVY